MPLISAQAIQKVGMLPLRSCRAIAHRQMVADLVPQVHMVSRERSNSRGNGILIL